MTIAQKYNIIDLDKGTLDRSIFTNAATYQQELEQVFGRAWLIVSHESLVPNPNDFFLSYMGEDPVIVTRDAKGEVHVFLNMCRHRGNRVVRADDGNAKNFMCTYHGWTFSSEGKLVSVPGLQEAYYGELDVEHLGLVEARVDTYAGIIFATWAEDAPTLEAYLGDARWYLDTRFNRYAEGMLAYSPIKWVQPVNWKAPVDNSSDHYHQPVTHASANIIREKFYGAQRRRPGGLFETPNPQRHAFVNGHSIIYSVTEGPRISYGKGMTKNNAHLFAAYHEVALAESRLRLGQHRADHIQLGTHSLFPNTVLGLRLAHPRQPLSTEFWHFALIGKGAPEEIMQALRHGTHENTASGFVEQDDIDNWLQLSMSGKSTAARRVPHNLSMGVGHSNKNHENPGEHAGHHISENNQRHFYGRWQEFMNAESWADIHIDPITATFEGTATMKG